MPTVRSICTDAALEIGAIQPGESLEAVDAQTVLRYFQRQLDAWLAERATLAVQKKLPYVIPSGSTSFTIGPSRDLVSTIRPTWVDIFNYVNPGSSPEQEIEIGLMTPEIYAEETIKELPSALPLQAFYQTEVESVNGTMKVWPQVTQDIKTYVYFRVGIAVPTTLDDILLGGPGTLEAYHYQLAERLLGPYPNTNPIVLQRVTKMSAESYARMKRPNLQPGQLSVDAALVPMTGGGYNVLSDTYTGFSR